MTEPNPFAEHLIRHYGDLSFEHADTGAWVAWWGPIDEILSRAGRAKSETSQEYQVREKEDWQRVHPPNDAVDSFDYAASRALALLGRSYSGEAFQAWLDFMRERKWKGFRDSEHSVLDNAFKESAEFYAQELRAKSRSVAEILEGGGAESTGAITTESLQGGIGQLCQEFERYANASQELGVRVFIQGERYSGWRFMDGLGNAAESDSVRIFKSLACKAARAAGLTGGQAGPEDWKLWLRHLCEVDPNFRITGQDTGRINEREFNSLKESGESTEGYVRQTVEFTETDLLGYARLIYSKQLHGVEFDQFVQLLRAGADLPQKGNEPKMPRVGESITKYTWEFQSGARLRIFNASAIRCMELASLPPHAADTLPDTNPNGVTKPRSIRKKNDQLETIRELVKQMKKEGASHREICERLGNHPRPPHAAWKGQPWPQAYRNHSRAVAKWLSSCK